MASTGPPTKVRRLTPQELLCSLPEVLREEFIVNDPVHGLMQLPSVVKLVVDSRLFQRMRHIQQLAMCSYVYSGATHKRFGHSLGTCYLAYELITGLRHRQPELGITVRDVLCVALAALCHDLGHPCYSHLFERFVHRRGQELRRQGPEVGESAQAFADRVKLYDTWTHEDASKKLLGELLKELDGPLRQAGLAVDDEGDDFVCIGELIDPPKGRLEALMLEGQLASRWCEVIRGRPVAKAWIYEIVSNWRSGIDVDKFDYFRRDAYYLGIRRQFDHERYTKCIKVVICDDGAPTISPPAKDKDTLRDNMLELRRTLHHMAYQHKTVKKLECHMLDILAMLDEHVRVVGECGRQLRPSEAAVAIDLVAYPKLTDTFVEALLLASDDPALQRAREEYDHRIARRKLMRLVAHWDLPHAGEAYAERAGPLPVPNEDEVIGGVLAGYPAASHQVQADDPVRAVALEELRCSVVSLHCGMGMRDPMTRVLFHGKTNDVCREQLEIGDVVPLRHKVFVFWNPPLDQPSDTVTLNRLTDAFTTWATHYVEDHEVRASHSGRVGAVTLPSPLKLVGAAACSAAAPRLSGAAAAAAATLESPVAAAPAAAEAAASGPPSVPEAAAAAPGSPAKVLPEPRRGLRIQASLL